MGKLVSANELRLWLKGQQVDATATRDLLSRLSPPPTLQGLPAVAGRLAVLLDRYPWFQHRKFQALIAAAQPGLSLITLQDWNDERHEPRADFERHAIYYALASNSVTQLVEELVVIFLVVELGRPNTKHRNARIGTTCYPTFRHLLAQALANQIPADLAVTLSLRPDPKALATRWATLLPSASINRRQIMALSTMANVFNACLDFVAETDPALLRLPTSTDEHISVTTTEPTKPAKEPRQKRWRVAATGAKKTAAIIHVRAPPEALKTRSLEGRSQHREDRKSVV